jgi:hypothetical protein
MKIMVWKCYNDDVRTIIAIVFQVQVYYILFYGFLRWKRIKNKESYKYSYVKLCWFGSRIVY